jgi:hypothetical protein
VIFPKQHEVKVRGTHNDKRPELLLLVVVLDEEHEADEEEDPEQTPDPRRQPPSRWAAVLRCPPPHIAAQPLASSRDSPD